MIALGFIMRATFGTDVALDGLSCVPTSPASMSIQVGPGSMVQLSVVDTTAYGSYGAENGTPLMKMGVNLTGQFFSLMAPADSGESTNYLIQSCMQEIDQGLIVMPYYNAANPAQPYSGPTNSGIPQATSRTQSVLVQLKAGIPSTSGTQLTPVADPGWTGLYMITVSYGQVAVTQQNIFVVPSAPFISWKLPRLRPGFGSGVGSFATNGAFVVPPGVFQIEVELWGGR